ncbi:hypothetical protein [Streptomyces sp. NPDC057325]|uniref:hypothetical protein n=1 Tax=unclassified Streptomyces TaxID=2593676 RepID=UPI0036250C86
MSSTSDGPGDGPGRLIPFPPGSDVTDRPVALADIDRMIPPVREVPPESAMERTIELPPVREPVSPESVLRAESAPAYSSAEEEYSEAEEEGEYEYEPRRTFMERVGDWLEYRIARGHAGLEAEGPYREAVIEAKVARLKAESDREIALLEAHNKLRQAGIQAAADKKTAQGKGDAAAMKSGSGTSASGGGRNGSGGGRGGSGGGLSGGGRNTAGSGGGRGGAGAGADKGGRKDMKSSAAHSPLAGRADDKARAQVDRQAAAAKANEDKRRHKDQLRQERQRAKEQAPAGSGRGGAGGGRDGARGSGGMSPRQERTAARQSARADRRAERNKARDQRRAAEQSAGLSDRTKDRDQARAERQRARDKDWADREARQEQEKKDRADRGAARAARREKRKARREEKKAAGAGRTTLGKAVGGEAQRRFDKRREAAEDAHAAKNGKAGEEKTKAEPDTGKTTDGPTAETVEEKTGAEKPEPDTGDAKKDDGKVEPGSKGTGETTDGKTTEPGTGKTAEEPEKDGAEKAAEPGATTAPEEPEKESGSADGETGKPAGSEESTTAAKGPESPSEPPAGTSAGTEPEEAEIVEEKPSEGFGTTGGSAHEPPAGKRSFGGRIKDRFVKNQFPEEGPRAPLWMEAEGERARPPIRPKEEEDIVDAHIIEPDDSEPHEADGAETPVSPPDIAQVYNRVCRFSKEPWVWETYIPSGKKVPKSPAATGPAAASKEPSGSREMDEESVKPWDLHHPDPPKTGSGKPETKADTAMPGPGTPAAEAVKVSEPAEEDTPYVPGEAPVNKADALAHLTGAQIVGFLVPGHSRPPAPSTPVWDDTATPAASGPGAEIPAQSAPPDPTPKEAPPMSTTPASSGAQLAAKHQTDITFDQYLVEMTNIALAALGDKETAEDLVSRLLATAKALLEIAEDLADDHNVDKRIVAQLSELSEALQRMTAQATRCAQECADAAEAAVQAAAGVARVYGQDMDAKREAGLVHASAAAHHN